MCNWGETGETCWEYGHRRGSVMEADKAGNGVFVGFF